LADAADIEGDAAKEGAGKGPDAAGGGF